MGDERFSNLAVPDYKRRTDSASTADVAQGFVSPNDHENRKRNFLAPRAGQLQKVAILGRFIEHIGYTGYYNMWRRLCYSWSDFIFVDEDGVQMQDN